MRRKLILALGHIPGEAVIHALEDLTLAFPGKRTEIYHALHIRQFTVSDRNRMRFQMLTEQEFERAFHLTEQVDGCSLAEYQLLERALKHELDDAMERLLWLFSFQYHTDKILQARTGLGIRNPETVANAFELLSESLPADHFRKFALLFEPGKPAERVATIRQHLPGKYHSPEMVLAAVLGEGNHATWTTAVAIHLAPHALLHRFHQQILAMQHSSELIIAETSSSALSKN